jgi:hypothetical protein
MTQRSWARSDLRFNLILFGVFGTVLLLWLSLTTVLSDYSARFVYAPRWEGRMDRIVAGVLLSAVVILLFRAGAKWRKYDSPGKQILWMTAEFLVWLGPAAFLWSVTVSAVQATLFAVGGHTATRIGVVTDSGRAILYRSRDQSIAEVRLQDGMTVDLLSHDSMFDKYLHDDLKVNGLCPLYDLPKGLPVTLSMRVSSLGYAVDRVTSSAPCQRPEGSAF